MATDETETVFSTPQFMLWAIRQDCAVKDSLTTPLSNPVDLLLLERTLRPLRCVSAGHLENRIVGDLCLMPSRESSEFSGENPPLDRLKGFSIAESLEGFGGEEFVSSHCPTCPANVFRSATPITDLERQRQYAGCYGYLQSIYNNVSLFDTWQNEVEKNSSRWDCQPGFQLDQLWQTPDPQQPRFLNRFQRELLGKLLAATSDPKFLHSDLTSLAGALEYSCETETPIQIEVVPAGQIIDRNWVVPQHCSNCIRVLDSWDGKCPYCDTRCPPRPKRKRHLKGDRPYWPLVRFVGPEETRRIANEYFQTQSFDQEN